MLDGLYYCLCVCVCVCVCVSVRACRCVIVLVRLLDGLLVLSGCMREHTRTCLCIKNQRLRRGTRESGVPAETIRRTFRNPKLALNRIQPN